LLIVFKIKNFGSISRDRLGKFREDVHHSNRFHSLTANSDEVKYRQRFSHSLLFVIAHQFTLHKSGMCASRL